MSALSWPPNTCITNHVVLSYGLQQCVAAFFKDFQISVSCWRLFCKWVAWNKKKKERKNGIRKFIPRVKVRRKNIWNPDFTVHTKMLPYMACILIYESDNESHQYSPQKGLNRQRQHQSCTEHHQPWWELILETASQPLWLLLWELDPSLGGQRRSPALFISVVAEEM